MTDFIKITRPNTSQAIETTMILAEKEFPIELLPLESKDFFKALGAFRKRKNAFNPVTKVMDLQTYFEDDNTEYQKTIEDLLDKHVRSFHGISLDGMIELDGTLRENKLLIGSIMVEEMEEIPIEDPQTHEKAVITQKRERRFSALIFDKAMELAKVKAESETKNS